MKIQLKGFLIDSRIYRDHDKSVLVCEPDNREYQMLPRRRGSMDESEKIKFLYKFRVWLCSE